MDSLLYREYSSDEKLTAMAVLSQQSPIANEFAFLRCVLNVKI